MKYQNKLNQEINFSIAGKKYKVLAMETVEITNKFEYVIESRKLPLKECIQEPIQITSVKQSEELFGKESDLVNAVKSALEVDKKTQFIEIKTEEKSVRKRPGPKPKTSKE